MALLYCVQQGAIMKRAKPVAKKGMNGLDEPKEIHKGLASGKVVAGQFGAMLPSMLESC